MTQFVLYMDEDSQAIGVADALARAGMQVHRSNREGNDGATDEAQLAFAASRDWVIYTANVRDFGPLHRRYLAESRPHGGIVLRTRHNWSIGEQSRRLVRIWESLSAEDMVNRCESLSQWGERD